MSSTNPFLQDMENGGLYPQLQPPPPYEECKKTPVDEAVGAVDVGALMKAADFAARRHRFQKRKDVRQTPYINHPLGVAHLLTSVGGITDTPTLVAALLHDTIEDTKTTAEEIEREFGAEVREIVQEVSEDKSLPRERRRQLAIDEAAGLSQKARLVHLADKLYNLNDLLRAVPVGWSKRHVNEYVESARALIAKIKGTNDQLEAAVDDAINQLLSKN